MRKTLRWLWSNLGLILLSLALSTLIWATAVEQENPTLEQAFPSAIPVSLTNVPEGMIAYGPTDARVSVVLRAPQSVWKALRPEDIRASVSLSGLKPGTHALPVQVQVALGPVQIRRVEPSTLLVYLENVARAEVPVRVRLEGNPPLGYIARPPETAVLTVTVSGPESLVAQVVEAQAVVSVEGRRADVDGEFDLKPYDAQGKEVPYILLTPSRVAIHVAVEQLSGFRDVAVTARLTGRVASGYRISGITVDPPVVTVYGAPEVISQIPGYLETAPLDLENTKESLEVRLPLVAPEGVSLLMKEPVVTVRVTVVPIEGSMTVRRPVEIQGLAPGLTATVAPEEVEVILNGPLPVLEELKPEDVRVLVDLFGLNPGRYSLEPQVVVTPPGVVVGAVLPATVQVEIAPPVTPTPGM
ncbi:MAG: CdaR family protein [Anaerolineae bacterium]|jgi:YbbR domain-containing protein